MKRNRKALIMAGIMTAAMALSGCQAEEKPPVILAVSFGTSFDDNREVTIGAVENAIKEANPDYEVRRAFTSQIVIDVIKENGGAAIDNVEQAFDRLVDDGVKELVVQPTHVMSGFEYDDLMAVVDEYKGKFDKVSVGAPLLTSDADYTALADALAADTAAYNVDGTAVVFMGHGTHHEANAAYGKLQETFTAKGNNNYFVGTVEGSPTLEDVIAGVKAGGYSKVVLQPLMVVAGDHANNDMAGDEEGSWKLAFEAEGIEVECSLKGLGAIEAVQDMYVAHTAEAVEGLN
ncbi:MAG: sirohydrochlorin cobaltochelatase [Oscillospiraceae bacterium]|nr:sirohydrochlorin cobaltochelatase [Oscillospiraceae bacterium]